MHHIPQKTPTKIPGYSYYSTSSGTMKHELEITPPYDWEVTCTWFCSGGSSNLYVFLIAENLTQASMDWEDAY